MEKKIQILVVEDDKAIRNLMAATLGSRGYLYRFAENGREALLELTGNPPDILILDLGLPDMDGVEIIRRVRTWSTLPIIIVSARSNDKDKVLALDEGADDYLTKPFSVEELLARLRVAWRRVSQESNLLTEIQSTFQNGPLHIDYSSRIVTLDQQEVHLTPIEYNLLILLARNIGKVLTHNTILKEVWQNYLPNDTPSLRVFMATLRKKIDSSPSGSKMIQTHVGVGYRMVRVDDTDSNN